VERPHKLSREEILMECAGDNQASEQPVDLCRLGVFMTSRIVLLPFPFLAILAAACGGVVPSGIEGPAPDGGPVTQPPQGRDAGTPITPILPTPVDGGSPTPVPDATTGANCNTTADCSSGKVCAWALGPDWCAAFDGIGTCVTLVDLPCGAEVREVGCACDGTDVMWNSGCSGLPSGYSPEPLAHAGACTGNPPPIDDAGSDDAPASSGCSSNADCPSGEQCGFPVGDCSGSAVCLPTQDFGALCNSIEIACSCAGTDVGLGCDAKASATTPIAFIGECSDSDGGL
jgi:hypothetical protein